MGNLKRDDVPKYMCQTGITQYELAESIDAAMASAEFEVKSNQDQDALSIWCEQVLDEVQEEFSAQKELGSVTSHKDFESSINGLLPLCWANYCSMCDLSRSETVVNDARRQVEFQRVMTHLLERSFINALDILHAHNIWRFDIQRSMQQTQVCILQSVQYYISQLGTNKYPDN
jgi:hypothetical protein